MLRNSFKDVFMQAWLEACSQHNTDLPYDHSGFNLPNIGSLNSFSFIIFNRGCSIFSRLQEWRFFLYFLKSGTLEDFSKVSLIFSLLQGEEGKNKWKISSKSNCGKHLMVSACICLEKLHYKPIFTFKYNKHRQLEVETVLSRRHYF